MNEAAQFDVRDLRLAAFIRRLHLRKVAEKTGIPYERVQRIFRGERKPQPGELQRIAEAIGIAASAVHADPDSMEGASSRDDQDVREPQVARG